MGDQKLFVVASATLFYIVRLTMIFDCIQEHYLPHPNHATAGYFINQTQKIIS